MIRIWVWESNLYSMKQWIIVKTDSMKHTKMHKLLIFSSIPMIFTCLMHDYSCSTISDQFEDNCQFRNCIWDGAREQFTIQKDRFGCKTLSKWIIYYKYFENLHFKSLWFLKTLSTHSWINRMLPVEKMSVKIFIKNESCFMQF